MSYNTYGSIESENFSIKNNFSTIYAAYASEDKLVRVIDKFPGYIATTINGRPGTYDVKITYYDENDGASTARFSVDGGQSTSWTWNKQLGSANAGPLTETSYIIRGVTIDSSATIRIDGQKNAGEEFRIDRIDLLPPADRAGAGPGAAIPAFNGAEGFGSMTAGGRGGWIVKVTNLNDSGVGSLRWALEEIDVPRIVVFDVGGVINLKRQIEVQSDVTVAGQTAPGMGVTITGGRLQVVGDDVIIRGLHIRPGSGAGDDAIYRDAISVGKMGETVERVVVDSNSFSWAVDEVASVWGKARDVTYSNNIIAEGLMNSIHPKGAHSMGMLVGDDSERITLVNNLYASNMWRNPQVDDARSLEFVNNLVYNYGNNGFTGNAGDTRVTTAHLIGNKFIKGPDSANNDPVRLLGTSTGTKYYLKDNLGSSRTSESQPEKDIAEGSGVSLVSGSKVFTSSNVSAMMARDVYDYVLGNVGARVGGLDAVDQRILNTVIKNTGDIINSPSQVGGLNVKTVYTTLKDTDGDGVPDIHEAKVGSNPLVFDPHGDVNRDGYTNIENYINSLIPRTSSGSSSASVAPPPTNIGLIEAENFAFVRGFAVQNVKAASGGAVIQANGSGEQRATTTFTGSDGVYDLRVAYFDENDGLAKLAVQVNGATVGSWTWGQDFGSGNANAATLTSRTIADVSLDTNDVIEFSGYANGGEPLRIDSLFIDG